jgi:hypothetical protein
VNDGRRSAGVKTEADGLVVLTGGAMIEPWVMAGRAGAGCTSSVSSSSGEESLFADRVLNAAIAFRTF